MTNDPATVELRQPAEAARWQLVMLNWFLPVVVVGMCLPVGLIAGYLAMSNGHASAAIDHGELYLAGGNAGVTGCVVVLTSRLDRLLTSTIVSLTVILLGVVPCYSFWAYLTSKAVLGEAYDRTLATSGGGVAAFAGALVAFVLVCYSHAPKSR